MKNICFPSRKSSGKFDGNMRALVVALPLILAACNLFADDVKLIDGRILKNAEVSKTEAGFITFQHNDGIARVSFEQVPRELQRKYGYAPQKDAELAKRETEAAETKAKVEATAEIKAKVEAILLKNKTGTLVLQDWADVLKLARLVEYDSYPVTAKKCIGKPDIYKVDSGGLWILLAWDDKCYNPVTEKHERLTLITGVEDGRLRSIISSANGANISLP